MTQPEHEAAAPTPLEGMVEKIDRLRLFLNGEAPLDAAHFGDFKIVHGRAASFWWRKAMNTRLTEAASRLTAQAQRIAELEAQGVCMCGEPIADHSGYENHSPVSQYDYRLAAAEARAARLEGERGESERALAAAERRIARMAVEGACDDALQAAEARIAELEGELARREQVAAEAWGDQEDEHTPAITAAHPVHTKDHETFDRALALVGKRHGKYELVGLVNWLLSRAEAATRAEQEARAGLEKAREALKNIGDNSNGWQRDTANDVLASLNTGARSE